MSASCSRHLGDSRAVGAYRRALWIVIALNATMFLIEGGAGLLSKSVSLQADALDFLGDTATYAITLFVLGLSLAWRTGAALFKGLSMGAFGLFVLMQAIYNAFHPEAPNPVAMGGIGTLALLANLASAAILYRYRAGDANMRSVWLCSRNDAIGNLAVVLAGGIVYATATPWPDLAVGAGMALLALTASVQIIRQALREYAAGEG